jgi:predicted enzyme related to lactoylglutathione lyase
VQAPIIFFDIAGPDAALLNRFYSQLFGWDVSAPGGFAVEVSSPLRATIRQDPAEKVIYMGVEDVAATLAEIERLGGSIVAPRFEVPGVVILGLFSDPAGNRMGLVEVHKGKPPTP